MKKLRNRRFFACFCFFSIFFFNILTLDVNLILFQSNNNKSYSILETSIASQVYWPTDGWLTTSAEDQDMNSKILSKIYEYIEEEQVNIHSVIIVRNGYIIEEGYLTYYKLRSVNEDYSQEMHSIYSVTKSITSLCIGVVEWDEGSIPYGNPGNDYTDMMISSDWVQHYLDKPMEYDPGESFKYSGGSSMLLSVIIQNVTNQTTSAFANESLFTPLGISEDHWRWDYGSQGITEGGAGLKMTPRDMAKIGLLCLNNGTWDGEEIISKNYTLAATSDQQPPLSYSNYGYQFWIQSWFPYVSYSAIGYMGQYIVGFPELSVVIVFTANLDNMYYENYIIENFILASIGVDPTVTEYIISGYSLVVIWSSIAITFLESIYLVKKKRKCI
jgi:CubicO group peptidase (beta-lactamase class C family)